MEDAPPASPIKRGKGKDATILALKRQSAFVNKPERREILFSKFTENYVIYAGNLRRRSIMSYPSFGGGPQNSQTFDPHASLATLRKAIAETKGICEIALSIVEDPTLAGVLTQCLDDLVWISNKIQIVILYIDMMVEQCQEEIDGKTFPEP